MKEPPERAASALTPCAVEGSGPALREHPARRGHEHDDGQPRHQHEHQHVAVGAQTDRRYLWGALVVLAAFALGEGVVAWVTNSLALLTDAFHMLSDIAAIGAAIWALRIAARPATAQLTFGWRRAEILSALLNGATLVVVGGFLGVEGFRRLLEPPAVAGGAVLVTALAGVAVNLVATWLLARANRTSLNIEGAYQHVLTDLYAFIGTAIAGLVMITTGWTRADAVASLFVCGLMLRSGVRLVRAAGWVLLEATPRDYDLAEIREHLLAIDGVVDVHDLHVWTVSDALPLASAHVAVSDACFTDGHASQVLVAVQECLRGHFDVEHSTFQVEPERLAGHADLH